MCRNLIARSIPQIWHDFHLVSALLRSWKTPWLLLFTVCWSFSDQSKAAYIQPNGANLGTATPRVRHESQHSESGQLPSGEGLITCNTPAIFSVECRHFQRCYSPKTCLMSSSAHLKLGWETYSIVQYWGRLSAHLVTLTTRPKKAGGKRSDIYPETPV